MVAPTEIVYFHQMLPFWSTFYYMMDSINEKSMSSSKIKEVLQTCSNIFNVDIAYFYNDSDEDIKIRQETIKAAPITS